MTALFILALALAMDAFAASLCQGAVARPGANGAIRIGAAFGTAQAVMPLLGWGLGIAFASLIQAVDHWVALALLGFLGVRMLKAGLEGETDDCVPALAGWALLSAAIATSIDAAAAGVTLPLLQQPIGTSIAVIGATTALLCFGGVFAGEIMGTKLGKKAEVAGGAMLILLGLKIFVEHQFLGA
ncbi:MAG TPA: manganese efflux pump MntP family protein [Allosphingosinicella sp.]